MDETLREIGADSVPALLLLNKTDRPEAQAALAALTQRFPGAVAISALQHDGMKQVKDLMVTMIPALARQPPRPEGEPPPRFWPQKDGDNPEADDGEAG